MRSSFPCLCSSKRGKGAIGAQVDSTGSLSSDWCPWLRCQAPFTCGVRSAWWTKHLGGYHFAGYRMDCRLGGRYYCMVRERSASGEHSLFEGTVNCYVGEVRRAESLGGPQASCGRNCSPHRPGFLETRPGVDAPSRSGPWKQKPLHSSFRQTPLTRQR